MTNQILQGAHDFLLNNPQFIDKPTIINETKGKGLRLLLSESMPGAFHDSSARYPPPRCHPGTRKSFIDKITAWGHGTPHHPQRILWMPGPAGSGKSAVAQSCAERLAEQNMLGATLFFSRSNTRADSNKLFTSLSYQIATKFRSYGDILDREILNDPNLLRKSITQQFRDLFVRPLQELRARGEGVEERVVIIDGLDECEGVDAQCDIVEIIAASVQDGTTPFRWAFFSRPEPHIMASFKSDRIFPLSLNIELPVSREIDHEILCYLTDEFKKTQERNGLPASWPSEEDLDILVTLVAGLFIYAATIVRFVGERNSLGPDDQLHIVLAFARSAKEKARSGHPLAELDLFYTLVVHRIPSKVVPVIQKILLLRSVDPGWALPVYAIALGFSSPQVQNAFGYLRSALELTSEPYPEIRFYHASFLEFMEDPERSKKFCVYSGCLEPTRRELLERLNAVHSEGMGVSIRIDATWPRSMMDNERAYYYLLRLFLLLLQSGRPLEPSTAAALVDFQFQMISPLWNNMNHLSFKFSPKKLRRNIPAEFCNKIVRLTRNPWHKLHKLKSGGRSELYVLGHGKSKVICRMSDGSIDFVPYLSIFQTLVQKITLRSNI